MELIQFTRALSLRDPNKCFLLLPSIQPATNEAKFAYLDECLFWCLRRGLLAEAKQNAIQIIENQLIFQPWIREHSRRLYPHFRLCQAPNKLQLDCRFAKSIVPILRFFCPDANLVETDAQQMFQPDVLFVEDEKEHESLLSKEIYPFTVFVHVNGLIHNPFLTSALRFDMHHLPLYVTSFFHSDKTPNRTLEKLNRFAASVSQHRKTKATYLEILRCFMDHQIPVLQEKRLVLNDVLGQHFNLEYIVFEGEDPVLQMQKMKFGSSCLKGNWFTQPFSQWFGQMVSLLNVKPIMMEIRLAEQLDTSVGESEHLVRKMVAGLLPQRSNHTTFVLRIQTEITKNEEAVLRMDCFLIVFVHPQTLQTVMQKRRFCPGMTLALPFLSGPTPSRAHKNTLETLFQNNRKPERLQPHQDSEFLLQQTDKYVCLKEAVQLNPFRSENVYLIDGTLPMPTVPIKKLFLHKLTNAKEIKDPLEFVNSSQVYVSTSIVGGPLVDVLWLVEQCEKTFVQGLYQYQRPLLDDTVLSLVLAGSPHRFV